MWTDEELAEDACRQCEVKHTEAGTCKLRLRFTDSCISRDGFVSYVRQDSGSIWELQSRTSASTHDLPNSVVIYSPDDVPVRTAKIHTSFRKDMLEHMLAAQRMLGNMVLFQM